VDGPPAGADRQLIMQFMTTEHFTLQTARAVVTLARLLQASAEWRTYGQGMNRIRHWYLEVAPEMEPYFVLPATDDPWASLAAIGVGSRRVWRGMLTTAPWILVVVNSVLAGSPPGSWPAWPGRPARSCPRSPERPGSWSVWSSSAPTSSASSATRWRRPRWPSP
jgi:hypothetical protein